MTDMVNHPPHYRGHPSGIECIDVTRHLTFDVGNAVKYVFRSSAFYQEDWRPFPSDPRYLISSKGRVRNAATGHDRKLVPAATGGYLTFMTRNNGKPKLYYVHRAVAETFIGPVPDGAHVCHNKGRSNSVHNLRIDTPSGNAADRPGDGTHNYGNRNPQSKLTEEQVAEIRGRTAESQQQLAAEYGVSKTTIGRILRYESWRDPGPMTEEIVDCGREDLEKARWYLLDAIEHKDIVQHTLDRKFLLHTVVESETDPNRASFFLSVFRGDLDSALEAVNAMLDAD